MRIVKSYVQAWYGNRLRILPEQIRGYNPQLDLPLGGPFLFAGLKKVGLAQDPPPLAQRSEL